jgi:chromatin segregation and condensation protein Rec8/ScpA/Scc1 (kleisin family)
MKDLFTKDVAKGVAIGVGLAAAIPILAVAARPAARSLVKSGILVFEKSREFLSAAGENFEDLLAEVRTELAEERLRGENIAEAAEAVVTAEES